MMPNFRDYEIAVVSAHKLTVIIGFFTIHVSIRISDRSPRREEQKKSSKIAPSGVGTHNLLIITLILYQLS